MKLYPAVDILDGRAVRLLFGNRQNVTVYGDPCEIAERFSASGAEVLHVVDLNGAFDDSDVNRKTIAALVKSVKIPVQLGGGIKSLDKVKYCVEELGVSRVVMGTAAVLEPDVFEVACKRYADKIVAGIDVHGDTVAIKGWVENSGMRADELATRVKAAGVTRVVFTDISRDGALAGVNVAAAVGLQRVSGLDVIASGGVRSLEDIINLKRENVYGAILGRALYTGDVTLAEALRYSR